MNTLAASFAGEMRSNLPSFLESLIKIFPYLGGVMFISFASLIVYFFLRKSMGLHHLSLAAFISLTGMILQWSFALPSPPPDDRLLSVSLYSFPDIHVARLTGLSVFLCFFIRGKWVKYSSVAAVALLSLSRIYVGAAYPRDIFGGLVLGIVSVMLVSRGIKAFRQVFSKIDLSDMITFILALMLSFFGLSKIFIPASNGGAEFLGLFGGLMTGHYISASLFPLKSSIMPKKITKKSFFFAVFAFLLFALSLLGINYFLGANSLDEIPKDAILLGLGYAAGILCVVSFNFQFRNEELANDGNK